MRLHDSQSSRENGTPSSDTSPVVSYKKVPPGLTASEEPELLTDICDFTMHSVLRDF